MSLKTNSRI